LTSLRSGVRAAQSPQEKPHSLAEWGFLYSQNCSQVVYFVAASSLPTASRRSASKLVTYKSIVVESLVRRRILWTSFGCTAARTSRLPQAWRRSWKCKPGEPSGWARVGMLAFAQAG
jgi:hypothetical protein